MKVVITAGPTYEPIDPVRFIGNRSSGKQGYAIAEALKNAGHDVTLISGPTNLADISDIKTIRVETAKEMLEATQNTIPTDIFIACAAVADWAPVFSDQKVKKGSGTPQIQLIENPDILRTIANHDKRPKLVIGFAAETEDLIENAKKKLEKKSCDWILANDVSGEKVFGQDENHVYLITDQKQQDWQTMSKTAIAEKLVKEIEEFFE
jgi:phosphopantothenoylcysteine decarboxylase/phosphopantothenate--cysteine ligase